MSIMSRILGTSAAPMVDAQIKGPGTGVSAYATGYMRGGRSVALNSWHPGLREAQDDVAAAWDKAAARSTDAIINSGWLSGAIDQCVANTVGTGLRLKASPENETFGMTNAGAQEWARLVEQRFELWANRPRECDAQGLRTFGQLQGAAFRGYLASGEILSGIEWAERSGCRFGTKVRVLHPLRLARDTNELERLHTGVYVDRLGAPIAYKAVMTLLFGGTTTRRVEGFDQTGRRLVGHFHDGPLGAYRGIGPLVPALQVLRQFDDLSDATLAGQVLKTLWAGVIESEMPTDEFLSGFLTDMERSKMAARGEAPMDAIFDMMVGYYDASPIDIGRNARIGHLMPGDKLSMTSIDSPGSDYRDYSGDLKRELARCLGMTYESFTGDYQGASYNSMSYGTTEIFEITKLRRSTIVEPFCQLGYEAFLEEAIERGEIPFPGGIGAFIANRSAASRAIWRGSPKPIADILKAAKAFEVFERLGVMSQGQIADAMGSDLEDVYMQRQQEAEMRKRYELADPTYMNAAGGGIAAQRPTDENEDGDGADD